MRRNLAGVSLLLLGLAVLFLLTLTLFESAFLGISPGAERVISILLLVLPTALGVIFGVMSLARKEGRVALAITGILLNGLFMLFHLFVVLFAG